MLDALSLVCDPCSGHNTRDRYMIDGCSHGHGSHDVEFWVCTWLMVMVAMDDDVWMMVYG